MTEQTSETALAVQEEKELEAALAGMDLDVAGEENLEPGDIGMPPRLRISQPNRPIEVGGERTEAGAIVNTLTNEVYKGVAIVPLVYLSRTRVMWPANFRADNTPVCASDDGKMPSESRDNRPLSEPMPGPCAECEYSKFGENHEPPRCKEQRNFLVWVVDADGPAILTMQSTALSAAKQFTALAKTQGLRKSIFFTAQSVKDDRGSWYVPAFAKGEKLMPRQIVALVEARDELESLVITADIEETTGVNGGQGETGASGEDYGDEEIPW